jgi:hypothetical protein
MVKYTVVQYLIEKKQDVSSDESLQSFNLKALCFAGLFPYEKICNTPRKLKLYRAYQIALYALYYPILFSQIVTLYLISEDLQLAVETVTHIVAGVATYIIPAVINWNEVYKLICKTDMSMQNKSSAQRDRKKTEILREARQKCKFILLFVIILGTVLIFCDLLDIFILHFVETIFGVEHKYKINPNAANVYESLLLEKYPFSCWTPFGGMSVTAHLAMYIYTAIPVFMMALRAGTTASVLIVTMICISLQFKFVSNSLEDISQMEVSISHIEQNTSSSTHPQHTRKKSTYRDIPVSATDGDSFHTPSQAQTPECSNHQQNRDTSSNTLHCVMDQEHQTDSDRLPSDNMSSPEDRVITIIKNHQKSIR